MPRSCSVLVGLLVVVVTACGLAQTADEFGFRGSPFSMGAAPAGPPEGGWPAVGIQTREFTPAAPVGSPVESFAKPPVPQTEPSQPVFGLSPQIQPSAEAPPSPNAGPAVGELQISDTPITLEGPEELPPVVSLRDFWGYRYSTSSLDWIPGTADQFGMFSIIFDHYQPSGFKSGLGFGLGFHFLAGPERTDMPPRVFDFSVAYQHRQRLGPLKIDLATSVRASSDFLGSARKGIRFPSHAVGFLAVDSLVDLVFGAEYLDRDDIPILPVAGLIWTPTPDLRFEMVFPRPRAVFQLNDGYRLYLAGELGGGTWAIQRVSLTNDLASYRDLRICLGLEHAAKNGPPSGIEVGYLFERHLQYSSGVGNTGLDDALLVRLVTAY